MTGITLNHAAWFGMETENPQDFTGTMDSKWLEAGSETSPQDSTDSEPSPRIADRFSVAEHLRQKHRLSGAVAEFLIDETECFVAFKGPGFSAVAFIQRESGECTVTVLRHGVVAVIDDLHKGRDSGAAWSALIDISAVLMTVSSLTGIFLLLYLRRIRFSGLVTAVVGTVLMVAVFVWLVP